MFMHLNIATNFGIMNKYYYAMHSASYASICKTVTLFRFTAWCGKIQIYNPTSHSIKSVECVMREPWSGLGNLKTCKGVTVRGYQFTEYNNINSKSQTENSVVCFFGRF